MSSLANEQGWRRENGGTLYLGKIHLEEEACKGHRSYGSRRGVDSRQEECQSMSTSKSPFSLLASLLDMYSRSCPSLSLLALRYRFGLSSALLHCVSVLVPRSPSCPAFPFLPLVPYLTPRCLSCPPSPLLALRSRFCPSLPFLPCVPLVAPRSLLLCVPFLALVPLLALRSLSCPSFPFLPCVPLLAPRSPSCPAFPFLPLAPTHRIQRGNFSRECRSARGGIRRAQ
jgi:hypothetical protein